MVSDLFFAGVGSSSLRLGNSLLIEGIHREVDTAQHKTLHYLYGGVNGWLQCLQFLVRVASQHIVNLLASQKLVSYAHAQTRILLAYELLYVAQAVVPAIAAASLEAEGAEG